jgi:hypothetical protein
MLEVTRFSVRMDEVPEGGPSLDECSSENILDRRREIQVPLECDPSASAIGTNLRLPGRFVGIDVTDPRNYLRVEQKVTQPQATSTRTSIEYFTELVVLERLGTEVLQQRMHRWVISCPRDNSETAGIVKAKLTTIIEIPDDMIMRPIVIGSIGDPQAAGHAEMNQQHPCRGFKEQVLGTSIRLTECCPPQSLIEIARNR